MSSPLITAMTRPQLRIFIFLLLAGFVLSANAFSGVDPDFPKNFATAISSESKGGKNSVERAAAESRPDEIDPWLERFLSYMAADADAQSNLQLKAVRSLAEDGDLALAKKISASIRDYRNPIALAVIASALVARGENDEALRLIDQAETSAKVFQDWRRRLIEDELFYALNAFNFSQEPKYSKLVGTTSPDAEGWQSQARLFGVASSEYVKGNLDAFINNPAVPRDIRALACVKAAEVLRKAQENEMAAKVLEEGAVIISERIEVPGAAMLLEIVDGLIAAGARDKALRWLTVTENVSNRLAVQPGWASQNLARCARAYKILGQPEKSDELFAKAESLLPKVEAIFLPETSIKIAQARGTVDQKMADQRVTDMLAQANVHPHHRAKAAAAIEALLYLHRNGGKLAELRVEQFAMLSSNIEKDPYYRRATNLPANELKSLETTNADKDGGKRPAR